MITTAITFAGNLVADPEVRFTTTGKSVAGFRVIANRRTRTETGEWTDAEPTGYSCKLWGSPAEYLANCVTRGDRVLVHGHVETETWTDRETSGSAPAMSSTSPSSAPP